MAKSRRGPATPPGAGPVVRLPNFAADAALGPASRTYRSPMEAYAVGRPSAVTPSQLEGDATSYDDAESEGAEVDVDDTDGETGELGSSDGGEDDGNDEG